MGRINRILSNSNNVVKMPKYRTYKRAAEVEEEEFDRELREGKIRNAVWASSFMVVVILMVVGVLVATSLTDTLVKYVFGL